MTDKGRELTQILLAFQQWGDRHKADPEGPPVVARHAGCGQRTARQAQVCGGPHRGRVDEIELVDGPGALPAVPA